MKICPICLKRKREREFVKYHIIYEPEVWITACKGCNFREYLLRKGIVKIKTKRDEKIYKLYTWAVDNLKK